MRLTALVAEVTSADESGTALRFCHLGIHRGDAHPERRARTFLSRLKRRGRTLGGERVDTPLGDRRAWEGTPDPVPMSIRRSMPVEISGSVALVWAH